MTNTTVRAAPPELTQLYDTIHAQIHSYHAMHGETSDATRTLETSAKALVEVATSLSKNLHAEAALKLRQRNGITPLYRLPVEVLVVILRYSLSSLVYKPKYFRRLQALAQVSYRWRNVLLHHPLFWANLSNQLSPQCIDTALRKSLTHPLHIKASGWNFLTFSRFVKRVSPTMARWKSLTLYLRDCNIPLETLSASVPNLESLSIRCEVPSYHGLVDLFNGGQAHQVRHIALTRCVLDWTTPAFIGLLSLELQQIRYNGPSFEQLIDILKSSPHLSSLVLDDIGSWGDDEEKAFGTVELPSMTRLYLDIPTKSLQVIMGAINAPNFSHGSIVASASEASVGLGGSEFTFKTLPGEVDSDERLEIDIDSSNALRMVSWINDAMPPTGVVCPVRMSLGDAWISDDASSDLLEKEAIRELFSLLPSITFLHLRCPTDYTFDLLAERLESVEDGVCVVTWLVPNLKRLSVNITYSKILEWLNEMLDSRYGSMLVSMADDLPYKNILPAKFDTLVLEGDPGLHYWEVQTVERIRDLVGKDNVFDTFDDDDGLGFHSQGSFEYD